MESIQTSETDAQPKWAPEPWTYGKVIGELHDSHGCFVGDPLYCDHIPDEGTAIDTHSDANGERIAACMNALAGIPTEALQLGVVRLMVEALRRMQRESPDHFVYEVRDRERLGWEGPRVQNWDQGCDCLNNALRLLPAALVAEIVPPMATAEKRQDDG